MNTEQPAISLCNLRKCYASPGRQVVAAVKGLSFEVPKGRIFGFLGPNGAGKTSTIKMLVGFSAPTSGTAAIFGIPIDRVECRKRVGYLPEQVYFLPFLTPREALGTHAAILGLPRRIARTQIDELLDRVGIGQRANTPIGKLSKGLTQRVGLAAALVGDPDLLILDEPGSGLDPIGRRELRNLLVDLRSEGKTVFLSSHLLSEVEAICDSVAMLSEGRLVALGAPATIKQASSRVSVIASGLHICPDGLPPNATVELDTSNSATRIEVDRGEVYQVMRVLERIDAPLLSVSEASESLEDAFVRLAA